MRHKARKPDFGNPKSPSLSLLRKERCKTPENAIAGQLPPRGEQCPCFPAFSPEQDCGVEKIPIGGELRLVGVFRKISAKGSAQSNIAPRGAV
jgi:hypothetical protein